MQKFLIPHPLIFSGFPLRLYHLHLFYHYRSFKRSDWWRHEYVTHRICNTNF